MVGVINSKEYKVAGRTVMEIWLAEEKMRMMMFTAFG